MGKILNIVIVILLLAALVYGYMQFTASPSTTNSGSLSVGAASVSTDMTDDGALVVQQDDFISLLLDLKQISLDTAFLSSSVFTSLTDFSREIPKQDVGRRNPFAPIGSGGGEGGGSVSQISAFTAPSQIQTTNTSSQMSAEERVRALLQEQNQTSPLNEGI